jgi:hypothetical protein
LPGILQRRESRSRAYLSVTDDDQLDLPLPSSLVDQVRSEVVLESVGIRIRKEDAALWFSEELGEG